MLVSNPASLLLELRETYLEICEPERKSFTEMSLRLELKQFPHKRKEL